VKEMSIRKEQSSYINEDNQIDIKHLHQSRCFFYLWREYDLE
jgi:hypothetical protein